MKSILLTAFRTELNGKEQELTPPQAGKVQIDFCLLSTYLDGKMVRSLRIQGYSRADSGTETPYS
jgi:hypothetical protein